MAPNGSRIVPGFEKLVPKRQGELDRLCGLYSIINGITLASYPVGGIPPSCRRLLFDEGIQFLSKAKRLDVVSLDGINERLWSRLRDHLLVHTSKLGGPPLQAVALFPAGRPSGMDEAVSHIFESIDRGSPVLLILWNAYDHCTVVAGYTATKLLLFDSFGFKWIGLRSLGLRHPYQEARHKLSWRSTAALVLRAR